VDEPERMYHIKYSVAYAKGTLQIEEGELFFSYPKKKTTPSFFGDPHIKMK